MKRKSRSTTWTTRLWPVVTIIVLLVVWQGLCMADILPKYMLPSPWAVIKALINDFPLMLMHSRVTIIETFLGLTMGVVIGFLCAAVMDRFKHVYDAVYPLVVITQTVPTVAIAPLLVLWFGYGILPKVILIVIVTFFPVTVSMLTSFKEVDADTIDLFHSMGASEWQIFWHVKFLSSLGSFFSSLRIAVSYAVVGAVIAEWLGGFEGLGVYMTRVRSSFSFDKMFAVIFLISAISLILMAVVDVVQYKCMPWAHLKEEKKGD